MRVFRPQTFVTLANRLSRETGEASHRSAISRAYYGAFLVARDLLEIRLKSPEVHLIAHRHLQEIGLHTLALSLKSLRELRNEADYDTAQTFERQAAGQAVRTAVTVLNDLASPTVQRKIRRYLTQERLKARAAPSSPARSPRGRPGRAHR